MSGFSPLATILIVALSGFLMGFDGWALVLHS